MLQKIKNYFKSETPPEDYDYPYEYPIIDDYAVVEKHPQNCSCYFHS